MPEDAPTYRDEDVPTDDRVADLLDRMTVAEKAGQLVGVSLLVDGNTPDDVAAAVREAGVGTVSPTPLAYMPDNGAGRVASFLNRMQRVAVEETRLGVPLLTPTDAVHGAALVGDATVFPHNLGLAAARDPGLVERVARATARELRAVGVVQSYGPTADVARDPRWGRTLETFGESHHLCGELAAAKVRGYQRDAGADAGAFAPGTVAATAKHFPAYGAPERGEDTAPVDRSQSTLHRVFVPPFAAAVDAGVACVMPCYNAVDGEPVHGSRRFLGDLLADLGFEGYVTSDWEGVDMLHDYHRTADSLRTAVRQSRAAGLDVASVGGPDHADHLVALAEAGTLDEDRLDGSVRRVLSLKVRLGLFEDPYVDAGAAPAAVGTDDHRDLAREAARRSVTLLENGDGVLPFDPGLDEVLVAGPNADSLPNQCGGWTVGDVSGGTTVREGVEAVTAAGTTVTHERGSGIAEPGDAEAAAAAARDADAAVVVLGEDAYIHEFIDFTRPGGGVGEFPTRSQLRLPAPQRDLLAAVAGTGTPTALVLVAGRPLAVERAADRADAVLAAYYPGGEGGHAVAGTLFGEHDPAGRLPVSVPRSAGHLPTHFDHLRSPAIVDESAHPPSYDPLYPFGHGLSYTTFDHEGLSLSADAVPPDGELEVSLEVRNAGDRRGRETVDLFVEDVVSSRVTPVREHLGSASAVLDPGERASLSVAVDAGDLGVVHPDGRRVTEPGRFEVTFGDCEAGFVVE